MDKEYIEREPLLRDLELLANYQCGERQQGILGVCETIRRRKAADVVEVIRCKECEHGKPVDGIKQPPYKYYRPECIICECEDVVGEDPMVYLPTHYCSYGKKRSGDNV